MSNFSNPKMQPHAPSFDRIAEAIAILRGLAENFELSFILETYDGEETMIDYLVIEDDARIKAKAKEVEQVERLSSDDDDPDGIPF